MKTELGEQALRSAPAVGGAAAAGLTLNEWVAIGTGVYILIQGLYLLRKWYREEQDYAAQQRRRAAEQDAPEADE